MLNCKINILLFSLIFCLGQIKAQYTTVQSIPNPKNRGNFFVSNPNKILNAQEERELDAKLRKIESESTIEIALVLVNSIGDNSPKTFATELFNSWGVGKASKNNGLVILVVKELRRIEFITGYGLAQTLTDSKCVDIQQQYIIPYFKEGNYAQGLKEGIDATYIFLNPSVDADGVVRMNPSDPISIAEIILLIGIGIWLLITLLTIFSNFLTVKEPYAKHQRLNFVSKEFWIIIPIVFILIIALVVMLFEYPTTHQVYGIFSLFAVLPSYFSARFLQTYYRNVKRNCPKTGQPMYKLDEKDEDEYLTAGQITEERIDSKQYDVWVTEDKSQLSILFYKGNSRKYSTCPKCKYTTNYLKNSKITKHPTYTSTGSEDQYYGCKHCNHQYTKRVTLARLVESSSDSGSGGGSWGGGSSGGSGGGSSW